MAIDTNEDLEAFLQDPHYFSPSGRMLLGPVDADANTALMLSIRGAHEQAFDILLKISIESNQVNVCNIKGVSALSHAAQKGRLKFCSSLLLSGALVNLANHNGSTALIQASHFGHASVVDLLIKHNAKVNVKNAKGTTALMRAAQEGHDEVVSRLLCEPVEVNTRNEDGMNALMLGSQRGHSKIVSTLIVSGASVDGRTVQGSTALMLACKRGHINVVQTLLRAGAELAVKDTKGRTARDQASRRGQQDILELLDPEKQMRTMQYFSRRERAHLLCKLYRLLIDGRAELIDEVITESYSLSTLARVLGNPPTLNPTSGERFPTVSSLPFALVTLIFEYLPLPRLWPFKIRRLSNRYGIGAFDTVVDDAMSLMDEMLVDLQFPAVSFPQLSTLLPSSAGWLVRIARNERFQRALRLIHRPMPDAILNRLVQEHDLQSVLLRRRREVTCSKVVAEHMMSLCYDLYGWYMWHEAPGLHGSLSPWDMEHANCYPHTGHNLPHAP